MCMCACVHILNKITLAAKGTYFALDTSTIHECLLQVKLSTLFVYIFPKIPAAQGWHTKICPRIKG